MFTLWLLDEAHPVHLEMYDNFDNWMYPSAILSQHTAKPVTKKHTQSS